MTLSFHPVVMQLVDGKLSAAEAVGKKKRLLLWIFDIFLHSVLSSVAYLLRPALKIVLSLVLWYSSERSELIMAPAVDIQRSSSLRPRLQVGERDLLPASSRKMSQQREPLAISICGGIFRRRTLGPVLLASECLFTHECLLVVVLSFFSCLTNSGAQRMAQLAHHTSALFSLVTLIWVWFFLIPVLPPWSSSEGKEKKTYYIKIHLGRGGVHASFRQISGPRYVFSTKEEKKSAAGKNKQQIKKEISSQSEYL